MALRPTCDVYRTARGVKPVIVVVVEIDSPLPVDTLLSAGDRVQKAISGFEGLGKILTYHADLCPRASDRLEKKILDGCSEPRKRKREEAKGTAGK